MRRRSVSIAARLAKALTTVLFEKPMSNRASAADRSKRHVVGESSSARCARTENGPPERDPATIDETNPIQMAALRNPTGTDVCGEVKFAAFVGAGVVSTGRVPFGILEAVDGGAVVVGGDVPEAAG